PPYLPLSCSTTRPPPRSTLFPYTTLFRSALHRLRRGGRGGGARLALARRALARAAVRVRAGHLRRPRRRDRQAAGAVHHARWRRDRKSTRLNSSHQIISYAVFCLKKKTHE